MPPDFRSLSPRFPEFWRIQLPQNPSQRCHQQDRSYLLVVSDIKIDMFYASKLVVGRKGSDPTRCPSLFGHFLLTYLNSSCAK